MHRFATVMLCFGLVVGCGRLATHPLVGIAKDEVTKNERVIATLGSPVEFTPTITGRANETDGIAAMQFEARGPKGTGLVVVEGKKLGDEWGVTLLELRPAGGGDHLHLTADLEARTGTDTPKFDPSQARATPASPAAPPPGDVEIVLPPGTPVP
ncbi:MAG: cytochrome c oxidase assembly factor Coa1 family protein [Planctomycetia bacterium]